MLMTQLEPVTGAGGVNALGLLGSLTLPGASSVCYYRTVEQPHSYAMIESLAAVEQMPRAADISWPGTDFICARHVCTEIADDAKTREPAGIMMVVAFCVPEEHRREVDDWYEREHAPLLLEAEGWLRARRYHGIASRGSAPWTHIALHDLRDIAVLESKERAVARSTQWRARLCQESWFKNAGRWIYERVDVPGKRV
jgi:hypothetical protein